MFVCSAILVLTSPLASARLGETNSECNGRYGTPQKTQEIIPGCPTNAYNYKGYRILIAFIGSNGPAVRMIFEKRPGPFLKDDEVEAMLQANVPDGMSWKPKASGVARNSNPIVNVGVTVVASAMGARAWKRDDGATAELGLNKMHLTLSLLAAEQLDLRAKEEGEAKRKAAIPTF